jgi:hypothetical protein
MARTRNTTRHVFSVEELRQGLGKHLCQEVMNAIVSQMNLRFLHMDENVRYDGPIFSIFIFDGSFRPSSARDSLDSSSSMFVTVTPPSVLAREKKLAIEKKKQEERAHYCAGKLDSHTHFALTSVSYIRVMGQFSALRGTVSPLYLSFGPGLYSLFENDSLPRYSRMK